MDAWLAGTLACNDATGWVGAGRIRLMNGLVLFFEIFPFLTDAFGQGRSSQTCSLVLGSHGGASAASLYTKGSTLTLLKPVLLSMWSFFLWWQKPQALGRREQSRLLTISAVRLVLRLGALCSKRLVY